jgi:hypothetical protein
MKAKGGGSAPNRLPFQVCRFCAESDPYRSNTHVAEAALSGSVSSELRALGGWLNALISLGSCPAPTGYAGNGDGPI